MNANLLKRLFGPGGQWQGPCVLLVEGTAAVATLGQDSIVAGGVKAFAPRVASGRIAADHVCYLAEFNVVLAIRQSPFRSDTGEDHLMQSLVVIDGDHLLGAEFEGLGKLESLGVKAPPRPDRPHFAPGTLVG